MIFCPSWQTRVSDITEDFNAFPTFFYSQML